jgi:PKD repeat protein
VRKLKFAPFACITAIALGMAPLPAQAAFSNDDFAAATVISTLPFSDSGDLSGTTTEPGEYPSICISPIVQTVWYTFTPSTTTVIDVDLAGSSSDVYLVAYSGTSLPGLFFQGCAGHAGTMELQVTAGQTYYFQALSTSFGSALLQLNIQPAPPPANDNFASATMIPAVPFSDIADLLAATVEPGEPVWPPGAFEPIIASVWYSITPSEPESLSASVSSYSTSPILAAYTGSSVSALSRVADAVSFGQPLNIKVDAGTTYYFQVGSTSIYPTGVPVTFSVEVAPPPVASFELIPSDPSVFDTVQFENSSFDPAGAGIASSVWSFGDGSGSIACCPIHRYATDGTYTVTLTVTTFDGRTGSLSESIVVKTHDVSISKFTVPNSASAGQTRTITVGVTNTRYPEEVQVWLYISQPADPTGFVLLGAIDDVVPITSGNKAVSFTFRYTFTSADAALGSVTFKAVATISGARDANPANNTVISLPTKVNH